MTEFKCKRLGDIANVFTGKCNAEDAVENGKYPLFDRSGEIKKSNQYFADCEAIIVPGESTTFVPRYYKGKFNLHQRAYCINPNDSEVNGLFLYYLIKANSSYFFSVATGATVASLRLNNFLRMKVNLPPRRIQDKIANILSTYDKLIENNNKRIAILEKEAEELYKEWFVRKHIMARERFEFTKKKLREIAIECGNPVKAKNRNNFNHYLPINCIPSKSMCLIEEDNINNAESSLISFESFNILFGAMRPYFHKVLLAPFDGVTRTTCFVIKPIEREYLYFLYLTLFQKVTVDFATTISVGSTMPYVRWIDFSRLVVNVPDVSIIKSFNKIIEPIIKETVNFYFINNNLNKQRDYLLPRLMSGKLEVM